MLEQSPHGVGALGAEPFEEALEDRDLALLPDSQQSPPTRIQVIHEGQIAMVGMPSRS